MKSNTDCIYGTGNFTSKNCSSASVDTICADSISLSGTSASNCTSAGLDQFSTVMNLTAADLGDVDAPGTGYTKVKSIIDSTDLPVVTRF